MSSTVRRSTHLSRHLQLLREQRGLRPGQLAVALGASNPSKVGSLIRSFELGEPLSDHWLQALIAELQPDPDDLCHCLALDQADAQRQLEQERQAWEAGLMNRLSLISLSDIPLERDVCERYPKHSAPRVLQKRRKPGPGNGQKTGLPMSSDAAHARGS
ncbi:hypothetical protein [Synechococcus sp. BMK-MC-1]|uniref:hypothetical protein n=1 Tax=Synechococcus sp. BMK-MC-1 TaxID=1442551 RepID=UPI0016454B10|nr:hypothetical protein [Synechococcus sp. BMK-MC-1]QNI68424.1 hypothetical protein SynBMKMC1_02368 [Synechococcus sp. BMK-MC-1]